MLTNNNNGTHPAHNGPPVEGIALRVQSICSKQTRLKCPSKSCGASSSNFPDLTSLKLLEESLVEVTCKNCNNGKIYCCLKCCRYRGRKDMLKHSSDCGKHDENNNGDSSAIVNRAEDYLVTTTDCVDIKQRVQSICSKQTRLQCPYKSCGASSSDFPDLTSLKLLEESLVEVTCKNCNHGKIYCCLKCCRYRGRKDMLKHSSDCGTLDESCAMMNDAGGQSSPDEDDYEPDEENDWHCDVDCEDDYEVQSHVENPSLIGLNDSDLSVNNGEEGDSSSFRSGNGDISRDERSDSTTLCSNEGDANGSDYEDDLSIDSSVDYLDDMAMADADSYGNLSSEQENAHDTETFLEGGNFNPFLHFTRTNGFPERSSRYFIAEHRSQGGMKAIVKRAFLSRREVKLTHDDYISQNDVNIQFHQTQRYYKIPSSELQNVCSMVSAARQKEIDRLNITEECYESAIVDVLSRKLDCNATISDTQKRELLDSTLKDIKTKKHELLHDRTSFATDLTTVTHAKDVRARLIQGPLSIVMNLPTPDVYLDTLSQKNSCEYAHIKANDLLNHMLAYNGYKCYYYRAGYEEDWDPSLYEDDPRRKKFLSSAFAKKTRDKVAKLVADGKFAKETRIVFFGMWSDGFGARAITANNEFNNLQTFTLRLRGEKDFILPIALLFKKNASRWLVVELLKEVRGLEEPMERYWSSEKELITTVAVLDVVSNDYIERTEATGNSQMGKFSKRWGHSCIYDDKSTPSCIRCIKARAKLIGNGMCDTKSSLRKCNHCTDWWSTNREGLTKYPLGPSTDILKMEPKDFPSVSLTFELVENSLSELERWYRAEKHLKNSMSVVKKYVMMICCADGENLSNDFKLYDDIFESNRISPMIKSYDDLKVEYSLFVSVVMHMFFLGGQKRLIRESNRLKVKPLQRREVKKFWIMFVTLVHSQQKAIKDMSVSWCFPMSFSTKKEENDDVDGSDDEGAEMDFDASVKGKNFHFSTVGWMSNHHASFARISLFQYSTLSYLSHPKPFDKVIREFRRLVVAWFCLVANSFGNDDVPALRIDNLVRYFLSCCRRYHKVAKDGDIKKAFYESSSNFFSLLNCKDLIEMFGSLRYLWEGDDEKFIKHFKREVATLRHNTKSLQNLLQKLLNTLVLDDLNEANPLRDGKVRSRTGDFKIYRKTDTEKVCIERAADVLVENQFISGVVGNEGKLYICFSPNRSAYQLFELSFGDTDGEWLLNLWYSKAQLFSDRPAKEFLSRGEVEDFCVDHFLLLKQSPDAGIHYEDLSTVICKSWKVRMDDGSLRLPMPRSEYLTFDDEDDT